MIHGSVPAPFAAPSRSPQPPRLCERLHLHAAETLSGIARPLRSPVPGSPAQTSAASCSTRSPKSRPRRKKLSPRTAATVFDGSSSCLQPDCGEVPASHSVRFPAMHIRRGSSTDRKMKERDHDVSIDQGLLSLEQVLDCI